MYKIQTLNPIASIGLDILSKDKYEIGNEVSNPEAILVRSAKMHEMELNDNLLAVARAGAGVNNIPLDKCAEQGIVVFNTPGANANGVKELCVAALLLASRNIVPAIEWGKTLIGKGEEVPGLIEKGKSNFAGTEIQGKTIGLIGLGAIGSKVAAVAEALGMDVIGYDPFLPEEAVKNLSQSIKMEKDIKALLENSDFVSLHLALSADTKGMLNTDTFAQMKKGAKIINMARGGLVDTPSLKVAIENGTVSCYVTDFPDEDALKMDGVISIPHLGASTEEAEDNCAIMAAEQIQDFIENGNIVNSVNYPQCRMGKNFKKRICIAKKNNEKTTAGITAVLVEDNIVIEERIRRDKCNYAFSLVNTTSNVSDSTIDKLKAVDGVLSVRLIEK